MSAALLDVNVLLALVWTKHVHHAAAHRWFSANAAEGWATCPLTQCAFVRISSNPKFSNDPVSAIEALEILDRTIAHPSHIFWEDDIGLSDGRYVYRDRIQGHRQITDAYLVGLCMRRNGQFATFDQGVATLVTDNDRHKRIILIPQNS